MRRAAGGDATKGQRCGGASGGDREETAALAAPGVLEVARWLRMENARRIPASSGRRGMAAGPEREPGHGGRAAEPEREPSPGHKRDPVPHRSMVSDMKSDTSSRPSA